ncbi:uncharacterized protein [Triticum aestivum]|uniref:uncharacterized protein n=1 Tax=Triticum aestivum TaxID=4565 RepID=UPI00098BB2C8|nr:uncharacterized protein LOC109756494 [Aegilops tauschii subsp. strangulata]XP_044439198.1 uncharacterized protein LOC123165590 [Triticum aestivum]
MRFPPSGSLICSGGARSAAWTIKTARRSCCCWLPARSCCCRSSARICCFRRCPHRRHPPAPLPPQHQRQGCWEGEGRMGGWALLRAVQPSQSRAGSSSPRLTDVVEYIFWNGYELSKVQVLRCLLQAE